MKTLMCAAIAACAGTAAAGTETYNGSFALATTNWSQMFSIPSFDTQVGLRVLEKVTVTLNGTVVGSAQAENLDAAPASITLFLQATISMLLDDNMGTTLATVIPVADEAFQADAFDGTIDFGGTSGASFTGLQGQKTESNELLAGVDDLSAFIDTGTVDLLANAVGSSIATGAGNIVSQFSTEGALDWEIVYEYSIIPAPAPLALMGIGGLIAFRRRR